MLDMEMCSRCGKNPAAVFLRQNNAQIEAFCEECAALSDNPVLQNMLAERAAGKETVRAQCGRCKAAPAIFSIRKQIGETEQDMKLCLACANEKGLPEAVEMVERLHLTDDKIQMFNTKLAERQQMKEG